MRQLMKQRPPEAVERAVTEKQDEVGAVEVSDVAIGGGVVRRLPVAETKPPVGQVRRVERLKQLPIDCGQLVRRHTGTELRHVSAVGREVSAAGGDSRLARG